MRLSLFFLVVLPFAVILSQIIWMYLSEDLRSELALKYAVNIFQISVFAIILIFYPPFPTPLSARKYYEARGFPSLVYEFQFVKNTLYFAFFVSIIISLLGIISNSLSVTSPSVGTQTKSSLPFFLGYMYEELVTFIIGIKNYTDLYHLTQTFATLVFYTSLARIIFLSIRKNLKLPFVIGLLLISLRQQNEIGRMRYLILALDKYNNYLLKHLKLQIHKITIIYSKISLLSGEQQKGVIELVANSFRKEDWNL